jgi:ABC-2 type transport system ATP-binding protein
MYANDNELIRFSNVTKNFYKKRALCQVSFTLCRGKSLAILGPGGAGKTTLLRILLGIIRPSGGDISILGEHTSGGNFAETSSGFEKNSRIGAVIDERINFPDMNASDYLYFYGKQYGAENLKDRTVILLKYLDLYEDRYMKIRNFTPEMKKKLSMIRAILRRPEILILDEPFAALDPPAAARIANILRLMKSAGTTLIIASQRLSGIEDLVEDVLYINAGTIQSYGANPAADFLTLRNLSTGTCSDAASPGKAVIINEAPRKDYFFFLCGKLGNPEGKI